MEVRDDPIYNHGMWDGNMARHRRSDNWSPKSHRIETDKELHDGKWPTKARSNVAIVFGCLLDSQASRFHSLVSHPPSFETSHIGIRWPTNTDSNASPKANELVWKLERKGKRRGISDWFLRPIPDRGTSDWSKLWNLNIYPFWESRIQHDEETPEATFRSHRRLRWYNLEINQEAGNEAQLSDDVLVCKWTLPIDKLF